MKNIYILWVLVSFFSANQLLAENDPPKVVIPINDIEVLEDAQSTTIMLNEHFEDDNDPDPQLEFNIDENTNPDLFSQINITRRGSLAEMLLDYAPDAFGESKITVSATDREGLSTPTDFEVNVIPVNDPPAFNASNPPAININDGSVTVTEWASFDPGAANENDQKPQYLVTNVANEALFAEIPSINNNGDLNYEGKTNTTGSSNFDVNVKDDGGTENGGENTSELQTFLITINQESSEPPKVVQAIPDIDSLEDAQSTTIDLYTYFEDDIDPDPQLIYQVVENTNPDLFTSVSIDNMGKLLLDYAPDAFGQSSITVSATDKDAQSTSTSFEVNLTPVNDAPTFAASDPASIPEDAGPQELVNWATFSAGPVNEQNTQIIKSYAVTSVSEPSIFETLPAVANNGTLTYTPAANQFGSSTFSVRVFDNGGTANGGVDSSAIQTFTITIDPVNDQPEFTAGDIPTILEDSPPQEIPSWATFFAGADNEDEQLPTYTVRNISNPELFAANPAVNVFGDLTYAIAANEFGKSTFELFVTDDGGTLNGGINQSNTLTFTIDVTNINDAPDFTASDPAAVNEDAGTVTIVSWATFSPGPSENMQEATYTVENISNPDLFSINPAISKAGTLTFTPANNAFGSSTISVFVKDNGGTANGGIDQSGSKTFTITVNSVNDAPNFIATNPPQINEDAGVINISGWASFDPGAPNESGQQPQFEVLNISNQSLFATLPTVSSNGTLTYAGKVNVSGTSNFDVRVKDDGGTANGGKDVSVTKTFTITINQVNDPPVFTSQPILNTNEDQTYTYNITYSDLETPNQNLIITASVLPEWLNLSQGSTSAVLSGTPLNEHVGSNVVTLTISDGDLQTDQSFSINVVNTNDAPYFTSTPVTKAIRNERYNYSINAEDDDVNDDITLTALEIPSWLTFTVTGPGRGELSGIPDISQANKKHRVRLRVTDKAGSVANQDFDIEVVIVNTPPNITSTPVTTATDGTLYQYNVIATDPDASERLSFSATNIPNWLTLTDKNNNTATLQGTPSNQDIGNHDVAIRVIDAVGASDTQVFTITVSNKNDPPVFTSTAKTVATEDIEYIYNITTSDPDVGDTRILSAPNLPGWLTLNTSSGDGTLKGTPRDAQVGNHTIRLEVTDAANAKAIQQFTLKVSNVNDEPKFTSTPITFALINQSYIYNITAADDDKNDQLKISVLQKPSWLNFTTSGSAATLSGTPSAADVGLYDVILRVEDLAGVQKLQEFTIKVNNPPVMSEIEVETPEDTNFSFTSTIFTNAYGDTDGDAMTKIKVSTLPANGTLNLTGTPVQAEQDIELSNLGQLSYVPAENDFGAVTFAVRAFDGTNFSLEPALVTIKITSVNDRPSLLGLNNFFSYKALVDGEIFLAEEAVIEDIDNDSIAGIQIFFTARGFQARQDLLSAETSGNIRGNYNEETGILNLLGEDSKENYIQVLQTLTYEYKGTIAPNYETRTINYLVDDGTDLSEIRQQSIEMIQLDALVIPSGITPNNDGVNDQWEIENIELYPNCQVKIFTREGREIFNSTGYANPWDGTLSGASLPAGTYFYVIVLNEIEQETGDITIIK